MGIPELKGFSSAKPKALPFPCPAAALPLPFPSLPSLMRPLPFPSPPSAPVNVLLPFPPMATAREGKGVEFRWFGSSWPSSFIDSCQLNRWGDRHCEFSGASTCWHMSSLGIPVDCKDLDFFQCCHDGINLAAWVLFILNVRLRYRQETARVYTRLANWVDIKCERDASPLQRTGY